ncbi:MAG: TMEM165/GDT1 family protein [Solirubrobacterales bacterium]
MSLKIFTLVTTYLLIVLAELGDKTQVAVLMFTGSNPARRWTVLGAAAAALVLCVAIEVTFGVTLAQYIGPQVINRIAGGVFLAIGLFALAKQLFAGKADKRRLPAGPACQEVQS